MPFDAGPANAPAEAGRPDLLDSNLDAPVPGTPFTRGVGCYRPRLAERFDTDPLRRNAVVHRAE